MSGSALAGSVVAVCLLALMIAGIGVVIAALARLAFDIIRGQS